ncbi:MAG TPA: hypothetical protein VH375_05125 [Rhodanobacteraceae bacterium]|jgi:hypothetical protein
MLHDAFVIGVNGLLLEAEGAAEPVDRRMSVVVAEAGNDRRSGVPGHCRLRMVETISAGNLASPAAGPQERPAPKAIQYCHVRVTFSIFVA